MFEPSAGHSSRLSRDLDLVSLAVVAAGMRKLCLSEIGGGFLCQSNNGSCWRYVFFHIFIFGHND